MDIERALISKIIATGQIDKAVGKGVSVEMFADEDCADMFAYIQAHTRKYKSPPSKEAAKEAKPDFDFEHVQDTLEYICDRFGVLVRKRVAQDLVFEIGEAINDPAKAHEIETVFLEAAREIATLIPSEDVAHFSDMDKRIVEYEEEAAAGKKPGISFGFPTLDEWTGGIQPGDFITAAAFSGVGKSTLLRSFAFNIYASDEDVTALYIALEEDRREIFRKFDTMAAHIDYTRMKQLGLQKDDIDTWREKAEQVRKKVASKDILVLDRLRSCTPDKIFMETVRHKPDVVFVDYLSLMRSSTPSRNSSMWQNLTEITQDLKSCARVLGVPIVAAAQTNRSSAKDGMDLENIGYALSVVQDSDIVIGLHADEQMREEKRMEIRVRKNRRGRLGQFPNVWNHDEMDFREENMADRFGRPGSVSRPAKVTKSDFTKKKQRPTRSKKTQRPTRRAA